MGKSKIGLVGLGNMGRGIAACFLRAGTPLALWDIDERARAALAGRDGVTVMTPGDMAGVCGTVFFAVPATPQIRQCLNGRKGVLAGARAGLVIVDLTTSDPAATRRLAKRAASHGMAYLDAGMSGGAAGAEDGTLTLMVGGDEAAFRRARRHLKAFADKIFYLGPSGAGHAMKVVHNMVCHAAFVATCEGARLAEKAGIGLGDAIAVLNAGNARNYASQVRFPRHIVSKKWDARSRVYNLHKDLGLAVKLAGQAGVDAALGRATFDFLDKAVGCGMAEADFSRLYAEFDRITRR